MGKLNIAHHKSYHPYRRDNIERVRRDEEEARITEAKEEGRMMLADSEARMDILRQRAGLGERDKKPHKLPEEIKPDDRPKQSSTGGELPTTNGHINLFHDIEQNMVAALTVAKKAESKAAEQGIKLAPDEKELRRWYAERRCHEVPQDDGEDDSGKSRREAQRKYKHDPLTAIEQGLASRTQTPMQPHRKPKPHPSYLLSSSSIDPSTQARLQRESSERERARALIQRKKKELEGSMTPSTTCGGDDDEGYRDVYNRQEVKDAHRVRDRRYRDRQRGW